MHFLITTIAYSLSFVLSLNSNIIQGSPTPSLSEILDSLLAKDHYDKRVHPLHGRKPVEVKMTIFVLAMNVNDIDQQFTVNMYMRQMWQDKRLAFNATEDGCIQLHQEDRSRLWQPDTFIVNEVRSMVHQLTVPNEMMRICPSGAILLSTRVTVTLICPMFLAMFPFDSHICTMELESYGMNTTMVDYQWPSGKESVGISSDVLNSAFSSFSIDSHSAQRIGIHLSSGNYTRLSVDFVIRRSWYAYKYSFFYPMITFSCVSLVTVWMVNYKLGTIVNLINIGIVNLFMAILGSSSQFIKKVTYATAMDTYFSISNGTIVACCLVTVINLYFEIGRSSNAQGIEMSRLQSGGNHDDGSVREEGGGSRLHLWDSLPSPRDISQGRWRIVIDSMERLLKIVFQYSHLAILVVYIVCNVLYWITYPYHRIEVFDDEHAWIAPIEVSEEVTD